MPSPSHPQLAAANDAPVPDETILTDLAVDGTLPTALTGRYLRIGPNAVAPSPTAGGRGDGMVHAVDLHAGRALRYRNRWVSTDDVARTLGTEPVPGPPAAPLDTVNANVLAFGGRTLALGPGALAYELDEHLATRRRVDLAGRGRGLGAHPRIDPSTGALHLVSYGAEPAHHVLAPNGQTRTSVPVPDAPGPLRDLLLTHDHLVLLGDGFVGIADRIHQAPTRWVEVDLRSAVAAHDLDGEVVVLADGDALVRWGFSDDAPHCTVLDGTSQRFGTTDARRSGPTSLWAVAAGGTEIYRHDLRTGDRATMDLGPGRHPGALTFVPDPARAHREDGGWLVGFVHDQHRHEGDLVVLDAALDRPPVATVRIPRRIPDGLHGAWIPTP